MIATASRLTARRPSRPMPRPVAGLGLARAAAARRILARAIATGAVSIGPGGAVTRRELRLP